MYLGPRSNRLCTITSNRCCPTNEDRERSFRCANTLPLDDAAMPPQIRRPCCDILLSVVAIVGNATVAKIVGVLSKISFPWQVVSKNPKTTVPRNRPIRFLQEHCAAWVKSKNRRNIIALRTSMPDLSLMVCLRSCTWYYRLVDVYIAWSQR